MSDADRLKDKLAKLGVPALTSGSGRAVTATDASDFLRAVLVEIDETVLARNLTFTNEAGASISFIVANRRLHRLVDASADFTDTASGLFGQQFSETSDDLIPNLAQLLAEFFAVSQNIEVSTSRQKDALDPGNVGCAADVIATAQNLVLYQDSPAGTDDRVEGFINQCSGFAVAWVRYDENALGASGGDDKTLQRLTALAKSSFADFDKQLKATFNAAPHCVIVGATDNGTLSVLYLRSGGQGAFMAIPTEKTAQAHSFWRKSLD